MTSPSRQGARSRGRRARKVTAAAAIAALAALLPALASTAPTASAVQPTPSRAAAAGSLTVSPSIFVAGQAIHFKGNIGKAGKRRVHLESNLNRAGDTWNKVPGTGFRTDRRGRFNYVFTAPSMFKISYRVAGGGLRTRSYLFNPRPQEMTLAPEGSTQKQIKSPFHEVAPGQTLTLVADAAPAVRSAFGPPPPIPGRTIRLQKRVNGNQWATVDSGVADAQGKARFKITTPAAGATEVYRAREDRWTAGANQIGWYASFPSYFTGATPAPASQTRATSRAAAPSAPPASRSTIRPTASERYHWGPSLFDFAWERGQDLSSPPSKGTRKKGSWVETSDGTGRPTPFNGGLSLQSKLNHTGAGDLGTTTATLTGNSQTTGRWEFRVQGHVWEHGAKDYDFRLELVPDGSPVADCSPESIIVGDFDMESPGMRVGVRSKDADAQWSRNVGTATLGETPHNVAVEVAKGHVTWYWDGAPVATVDDADAYLGANLVPRFSLVGQQQEMDGAQVDSDWQRAWTLAKGTQVTSGAKVARSPYDAC